MPALLNPSVQLTLIYGDAPLLIERAVDELVEAILPGDARRYGLTVVDLEQATLGEVSLHLTTGSLMAATRVVVLRNVDALKAGEPAAKAKPETGPAPRRPAVTARAATAPAEQSRDKRCTQNSLAAILDPVPLGLHAILTFAASYQEVRKAQEEAKGPPVAAKLRKLVHADGQSAAFVTPFDREMADWAAAEAHRIGKRLDRGTAERLVEMVGRDHARLSSELQKLACYVGDAPQITSEDVTQAASRSAEASSFDLVDAIAEGDAKRALSFLPDLVPSQNAQSAAIPLLGMIARHLRLMWQAAYLAQCGSPVDRGTRVSPEVAAMLPEQQNALQSARSSFFAKKLARHARTLGDREVALALQKVLYADRALKGQTDEHLDPRLVMDRLVTELCLLAQRAAKASRAR